jgi:hypothetical protein
MSLALPDDFCKRVIANNIIMLVIPLINDGAQLLQKEELDFRVR